MHRDRSLRIDPRQFSRRKMRFGQRQCPTPPPKPTRTRRKPRPIGVPGPHLCRIDLSAVRPTQHKCRPGSPGERDAVTSPGSEEGRRRAIGVVAALSIYPLATTTMVRRWVAGTPMRPSGPEGRGRGQRHRRCRWLLPRSLPLSSAAAAAFPDTAPVPAPASSRLSGPTWS